MHKERIKKLTDVCFPKNEEIADNRIRIQDETNIIKEFFYKGYNNQLLTTSTSQGFIFDFGQALVKAQH